MCHTHQMLSGDWRHHASEGGRWKSKTRGGQWKMSSTASTTLSGLRRGTMSTLSQTESVSQMSRQWVHEVRVCKYTRQNSPSADYNGPQHRTQTSSNFRRGDKQYNKQPCTDQGSYQPNWGPRKLVCYYCEGENCVRHCKKFSKDKAKYKLKTADLAKKYKDKFRQASRKGNVTVNEETLSSTQESTYSIKQAEKLLGSFSSSKSNWLDGCTKEVPVDEASSGNVILYKGRVNNTWVDSLYDTGASISVMAKHFFYRLQNKPN